MTRPSYAVVNPTIGRPGLARLVATVDGDLSPSSIVVADDWRDATTALDLPATTAPLVVVRTNGRGPAAARNVRRRAFREDADLGLRTVRAGYAVVWGERVTTHPLASPSSLRSQPEGPGGQCRQRHAAREICGGGGDQVTTVPPLLLAGPTVRALAARARVATLVRPDSTKRPGCYREWTT
jgi:hypothetical protein